MKSLLEKAVDGSNELIEKGKASARYAALGGMALAGLGGFTSQANAQEVEMPDFTATVVGEEGDTTVYRNLADVVIKLRENEWVDFDPDKYFYNENGVRKEGQHDFAIFDLHKREYVKAGPNNDNTCLDDDGNRRTPGRLIVPTNVPFVPAAYGFEVGDELRLKIMNEAGDRCRPVGETEVLVRIIARDGDDEDEETNPPVGGGEGGKKDLDGSLDFTVYGSAGSIQIVPPEAVDPRGSLQGGGLRFRYASENSLFSALAEFHGIEWDYSPRSWGSDAESIFLSGLYVNSKDVPLWIRYDHGQLTEAGSGLSNEFAQTTMDRPAAGLSIPVTTGPDYLYVLLGGYANFLQNEGAATRTEFGVQGGLEARTRGERVGAELSVRADKSLNEPVVYEWSDNITTLDSSTGIEVRGGFNFYPGDSGISIDVGGMYRGRIEDFTTSTGATTGESHWYNVNFGVTIPLDSEDIL